MSHDPSLNRTRRLTFVGTLTFRVHDAGGTKWSLRYSM